MFYKYVQFYWNPFDRNVTPAFWDIYYAGWK